jgi:hypothetical protein
MEACTPRMPVSRSASMAASECAGVRELWEKSRAAEVVDVGHDPAQLRLPGVPVRIDEAGREDGAGGIDDHSVAGVEAGGDGSDRVTLDEQIAVVYDAEVGVQGDDPRAGEQDAPFAYRAVRLCSWRGVGSPPWAGLRASSGWRSGTMCRR